MKPSAVNLPFASKAFSSLRTHLRIPLFANAYALMTNQVLAAGVGFLYWLLAARLYPDEVVGVNSAIISTIIFMATLAELSFKSAMIRFVPRAGRNTPRLIGGAFGINLSIAFLVSLFLVTAGRYIPLTSSLLENVDIAPGWLILATATWSIFYIQDGVLIGMRQSKWVLAKNIFLSISKLLLLVVLFRAVSGYGLVISWFITVPFLVLLFFYLIFFRFMPQHIAMDLSGTKPITRRELFHSITGDHVGTLLAETSTRLLPLLVLHLLGQSFTAYYYQGWNVASTLYLLATSMTNSFMVEASANMQQLSLNSRRIMRQMASLLIPAVAALWLAAPLILRLFGANYALQSVGLLRWLALATLPYMLTTWYLSYSRVLAKVKTIILVQALQLVITLTMSYLLVPVYGIVSIGIAWFIAHCTISVLAMPKLMRLLLTKSTELPDEKTSPNRVLRRADWRFLLPEARIGKSACFADGLLAEAAASVSEQVVPSPDSSVADCDLAIAIDPNRRTLRRAYNSLKPDGVCYLEWSAWRKGGLWGIKNQLRRAGFTWVKFYLPAPSPVRPRIWFPLQSGKAPYGYIAHQMFPTNRLIHKVERAIVMYIAPLFIRIGLVPHVSTVAGRGTPSKQDVFEIVRQKWSISSPGVHPDQLSFLMQTSGSLLSNNIIGLVFAGQDIYPQWVIKIPRMPQDAVALRHEKEVLMDLRKFNEAGPKALSVPRFILDPVPGAAELYGQSAMRGKSLAKLLQTNQFETVAEQITAAQIALARHSKDELRLARPNQLVTRLMAGLDAFTEWSLDRADIDQTRRTLSVLEHMPATYAHNDFAVWNMVVSPDGLGVFDWSDADKYGLPLLDLVYGLAGAAFMMEHADTARQRQESYLRLLDPETPYGKIFHNCLLRYAREVGLDPGKIPSLRLATWVLHSTYERSNHQLALVDSNTDFESLCTPLWKAELMVQMAEPGSNQSSKEG